MFFFLSFSPTFDIFVCIVFLAIGLAVLKTFEASFFIGLKILSTMIPDPLC